MFSFAQNLVSCSPFSARMEKLPRGNLWRGVGLCLLLLLVHEASGHRRKIGRESSYRLNDDGEDGNFSI